jgi:hypothetical protein
VSCSDRDICIFYSHLAYFTAIWYTLWTFAILYGHLVYVFYGNLVYFSQFWYVVPRKIWHPWSGREKKVEGDVFDTFFTSSFFCSAAHFVFITLM